MPSKTITSLQNDQVKMIVRLRDSQERRKSGLTLIDGLRESGRALAAKVVFKEVFVCRGCIQEEGEAFIKRAQAAGVDIIEVDDKVYAKMAYGERNDGIISVVRTPKAEVSNLSSKALFFVVVEGVEKPGNLGAILRSCDGVGVDGVIVCDGGTDLYNPNVIRASVGTVFTVPCVAAKNEEVLDFLRSRKVRIFASLPQATTLYTQAKLTGPIAFVLGSEDAGLSEFWKKASDEKLRIPMKGAADSLNVSASTAVLLYEALRQRSGG